MRWEFRHCGSGSNKSAAAALALLGQEEGGFILSTVCARPCYRVWVAILTGEIYTRTWVLDILQAILQAGDTHMHVDKSLAMPFCDKSAFSCVCDGSMSVDPVAVLIDYQDSVIS